MVESCVLYVEDSAKDLIDTEMYDMFVYVQNVQADLDADRYKQCIDYVSRYGSHFQHISFVNKWRGLQDAITTFKQLEGSLLTDCHFFFNRLISLFHMGYWHQRADERHGNPPPR